MDVATGDDFALILKTTGKVEVTNNNEHGALATGDRLTRDYKREATITDVKAISAGKRHSLFLKNDGSLYVCGDNGYGQLGDEDRTKTLSEPKRIESSDVVSIACTAFGSLYVKTDGNVYAFGYNKNGTLGTGSFDDVTTPVKIDNKHSLSGMVFGYDPKTVSNTTGTQMVQDEVSREYSKVENNCVSYNEDRGLVFDFNERRDYFNAGNTHTSVLKSVTFSISFWCNLRAHTSTEYRGRNGMLVSNWYSSTSSASNNAFIVYSTNTFVSMVVTHSQLY